MIYHGDQCSGALLIDSQTKDQLQLTLPSPRQLTLNLSSHLMTCRVYLLPHPPSDVAAPLSLTFLLLPVLCLICLLLSPFVFLSASSSSSFWLFLLFSAQCNSVYRFLGDPALCVAVPPCRGIPSLFSAAPCWGGGYYFPSFSSSSSSSSSSFCAHTCASAIGHRGANHQCSHRPT